MIHDRAKVARSSLSQDEVAAKLAADVDEYLEDAFFVSAPAPGVAAPVVSIAVLATVTALSVLWYPALVMAAAVPAVSMAVLAISAVAPAVSRPAAAISAAAFLFLSAVEMIPRAVLVLSWPQEAISSGIKTKSTAIRTIPNAEESAAQAVGITKSATETTITAPQMPGSTVYIPSPAHLLAKYPVLRSA